MANNQDARPFVDLKKDAQEFRTKFDEDINECLSFLDAKITALICDPDSFGASGRNIHQNTLAEFSKAKYDIFIGVKSLINAKEREWLDYIAEMKKLFIENVEIFLAGTKLEVKLPTSESASSHSSRKSPGNRKSNSTSVTSSIYPILSTITKNIPVLGSSFQEKNHSSVTKENVGEKTQFNRRGKLSTSSIKLANSLYDEEMDIEEPELDRSRSHSSSNTQSRKLSNSGLNTSHSSSGRRSSLKKEIDIGLNEENISVLQQDFDTDVCDPVNINHVPSKTRGRRGKLTKNTAGLNNIVTENSISCSSENGVLINESAHKEISIKGRRGRSAPKAKTNNLTAVTQSSSCSTDENEDQTQTIENEVPLKSFRGRSASKAKTNDSTGQNIVKKSAGRGRKAVKPAIEEEIYEPGPSKSPKKVSFGGDQSSSDELEIETPVARPVKSAARRKTLLPNLEDLAGTDVMFETRGRSKAKRKTISGVSELEAVAPSKRLKVGQKISSSEEDDNSANSNLLESDGNYSEWMSLKSVDGKIPTQPAVYEMKVWRAKKPAYIGSCENLRQKLTLYNLRQNSGHKHLDKYIDRNYNEIQVRYEVISSFNDAKQEVKNRIESFKAQHKTTPAYN